METRPAYFRSTLHLLRRRHGASRFARCRTEKTRRPVQSQKIQRSGHLLRQPAREIREGANGLIVVAPACGRSQLSRAALTAHGAVATADMLNSGALGATLFAVFAFARRRRSWLFRSGQPHELIEIKRAATFGSHFSEFDLVPAVHPIYLIAFLPNTHRFAGDYAMN